MINHCPSCGNTLPDKVFDGIGSCQKCDQVFSTSEANTLLAAGWCIRKHHGYSIQRLRDEMGITDAQAEFVYEKVVEDDLSHEEFVKAVKKYTSS